MVFNSKTAMAKGMNDRLHTTIPGLIFSFDTETTGKHSDSEPISYGYVVHQNGEEIDSGHFLSHPTRLYIPGQYDAEQIHGITTGMLADSYHGNIVVDGKGTLHTPALHPQIALNKMLSVMAHYQDKGAVFLGHNVSFDYTQLKKMHRKFYGDLPMISSGFDIDAAEDNTIDTYKHAKKMKDYGPNAERPSGLRITKPNGTVIQNAVENSEKEWVEQDLTKPQQRLDSFRKKYNIIGTGEAHGAESDARAAAQLFFRQVAVNRGLSPRTSSVMGPAKIDYEKFSPFCTGKMCKTCKLIDDAEVINADETGNPVDEHVKETIKRLRKIHKK